MSSRSGSPESGSESPSSVIFISAPKLPGRMRGGRESPPARSCCGWSCMELCTCSDTTIRPGRRAPRRRCGGDRKGYLAASSDRLLEDFNAGKPAALARVVSIVENHRDGFEDILGALHPRTG